jgi:Domain of unknown function (DUF4831)
MKKKSQISIVAIEIIFLISILSACTTRLAEVKQVNENDKLDSHGFFYSLPKTAIRIEIPIKRAIKKPGPLFVDNDNFYQQANSIGLSKNKINKKLETKYSIGDPIISSFSLPDPDATFFVKMDSQPTEELILEMELTESGLMERAKSESTNRLLDIGVKTLEAGASIAGNFIKYGGMTSKRDLLDAQIEQIKEIRKSKYDLISGNSVGVTGGMPAETLKLMISELNKEEKRLLNAIQGTKEEKEWIAIFEFIPTTKTDQAKFLSITDDGTLSISPTCVNCASYPFGKVLQGNTDELEVFLITKAQRQPADILKTLNINLKENGSFYYRIPLQTEIQIFKKEKLLSSKSILVAHLGPKYQLAKKFQSRTGSIELFVYTNTGAIKKINNTAKPFDAETAIETLGTSAANLSEIILKGDDEITKLEREKEILELKKAIRDLEKDLDSE